MIAAQFSWNRYYFPACHHCLKSLETPLEMLTRLTALVIDNPLPSLESFHESQVRKPSVEESVEREPYIECDFCSKDNLKIPQDRILYCSKECQKKAWSSYHKILCSFNLGVNKATLLNNVEMLWRYCYIKKKYIEILHLL